MLREPVTRQDKTRQLYLTRVAQSAYTTKPGLLTKLVRGITSRLTPDLGRVFYSFDKSFETGADPRNSYEKHILKIWTPCLSACLSAFDLARDCCVEWGVESSRHRAIFEISSRTVEKL